ncbi:uncharacterized protein LOC132713069 [Ruditapes philippinarum]|uniref:uncharacterized protein LOC132713069 n=1 Tax=Ruditapes philippinarum TaxID=129788 RepID=UPI00295C23FE|nr:uncharacterized protein LOC132713069 [Ruditapes philippinarum]
MKVLLLLLLGTLYNDEVESKCSPLLMCPTFCMKVQKGCYVCDCGTFSNYLRQASDKMADKSNTQQQQQTGTRLSSYTSGYGVSRNSNDMFKSNNDQRVQDYTNMMKLGLQFMNVQSQPIVRQNVGLEHPGLTSYDHKYENMPGMNCIPVDSRCPSSCWNTNVFTGCIHCACGDGQPQIPTIESTKSLGIFEKHTTSVVKQFENHSSYGGELVTTTASPQERITTTTDKDEHVKDTISTTLPYNLPYFHHFKIPTKPPTHRILGEAEKTSTEIANRVSGEGVTMQPSGHLIPTLFPPNRSSVPTHSPFDRKLILHETKASMNENEQYNVATGIRSTLPTHVEYPTPVLIPETSQSVQQYTWIQFPTNKMLDQQLKNNFPEELTAKSMATDHFRDNTSNTTINIQHHIKQLDSSGILESLLTPLDTATENEDLTAANSTQQILVNQLMPFIGHDDNLTGDTSSKGVINHIGFYGHIKTG